MPYKVLREAEDQVWPKDLNYSSSGHLIPALDKSGTSAIRGITFPGQRPVTATCRSLPCRPQESACFHRLL